MAEPKRAVPDIAPDGELFDIALGLGKHIRAFAASFSSPFAYYWEEWPDSLIGLPNNPQQQMMLSHKPLLEQYLPIILNRLKEGAIPGTTIRFNLQGLTEPRQSVTMMELGVVLADAELLRMTRFYGGPEYPLEEDDLAQWLKQIGLEFPA